MAYDERLAERVRGAMGKRKDVVEKKMFGGIAFMVRGHMSCGIVGSSLMVRIDPAREEKMLRERGAKPMDFTGRPMRGFLYWRRAGGEGRVLSILADDKHSRANRIQAARSRFRTAEAAATLPLSR